MRILKWLVVVLHEVVYRSQSPGSWPSPSISGTSEKERAEELLGYRPRLGVRVRDRDGDVWRFGRTRWSCEAEVDGVRVQRVGRLRTGDLIRKYGPLSEPLENS